MTSLREPGPPSGKDVLASDDHSYAMWDGAYVLGSLSAADRREFEAHLTGCPACRCAVAKLSGMPGLLSQLNHDDTAAIDDSDPAFGASEMSPQLLPSLLATVRSRRRRARLISSAASAVAAAVLAICVFVGVQGEGASGISAPPQATVSAQPMAQVGTTTLASTVSLSTSRWGTLINLDCICLAPLDAHHDTLAMIVVGHDGSQTRLATWVAEPGHTATPAGSISTPVNQIAEVQVVSADTGQVLLDRSL